MYDVSDDPKLLIIGVDGASYNLVKEWAEKGQLATFQRLIKTGSFGLLTSTTPPITFPAIPSFMTGKNPGKHGVATFFRPTKDGSLGLVSSHSIKDEFWNVNGMNKRIKLIINLPLTYPAKPLNGCVITGFLTPSKDVDGFIYPSSLKDEIKPVLKPYIIDKTFEYLPYREIEYLSAWEKIAIERTRLTTHLINIIDWDICIVYFIILDRIQHNLFGRDNNLWVLKGYKIMDKCIEKLISSVEENTNLIVFSDHGFGRSKGRFYPNAWLKEEGYLSYKKRKHRISLTGKIRTSLSPVVYKDPS